jgi:DNA-directed RNA polymerase specialized sigma24 family protein
MEKERESDWTFRASDKSEQNFMGIPGPPHRWTEEELVAAAQNGDSSALEELLQQHRALLHGTVRRLMASADETDDVVQDAMLRAFMNIGRFRKEARFSSWLIAIGINSALSCRRRSNRVQLISLDEREATSVKYLRGICEIPAPHPNKSVSEMNCENSCGVRYESFPGRFAPLF